MSYRVIMYIVYQNAVSSSLKLREKWYTLKNNLLKVKNPRFRSSISSNQHIQPFKYNRLINCTLHRDAKVYSDILCNKWFDLMENWPMEQQLIEFDYTSVSREQSTEQQSPSRNKEAIAIISGLQYVENYIDEGQHDWALARIDEHEWLADLKRRVQHSGIANI